MNISPEIVNGMFTLAGAIIGALLTKYNIPFWIWNQTRKYQYKAGAAPEFEVLKKDLSGSGQILYLDSNSQMRDALLEWKRERLSFSCSATFFKDGKIFAVGTIDANGVEYKDFGFSLYKFKDSQKNRSWRGVMVFRNLSDSPDTLNGIWITVDKKDRECLSFGTLNFNR